METPASDQWSRISELFGILKEASPSNRDAMLRAREEAGEDPLVLSLVRNKLLLPQDHKPRQIGQRIQDRYIVEQVYYGGLGTVYIAWDPIHRERYAVKCPRADRIISPNILERFWQESNIWVSLGDHPNIVRARFVDAITQGGPLLFLEYVEGSDLRKVLSRGTLPLAIALDVVIQCCDGMQHSHDRAGVVHRDLKPENILMTPEGLVKITDFGLARSLGLEEVGTSDAPAVADDCRLTHHGDVFGTLPYMPLEQLRGATDLGVSVDVYALGVLLFEVLTGKYPFDPTNGLTRAEGPQDRLQAFIDLQEQQRPPLPSSVAPTKDIPGELDALILKCLERLPEHRYESFRALREAVTAVYERVMQMGGEMQKEWENAMIDHGLGLDKAGQYREAIACYETVLTVNPRRLLAAHNKSNSAMNLATNEGSGGGPPKSDGDFNEMLRLFESAVHCANRSLQIDPTCPLAWNTLGGCLVGLGRFQPALECFDRAIALKSDYEAAWYNRGTCLRRLERHQDALESYDRALALRPRYPNALNGKGTCLGQMGRYSEAISCLHEALAIAPDNDSIRHNMEMWKGIAAGKKDLAVYVPAFHPDASGFFARVLGAEQDNPRAANRRAKDRSVQELCDEAWGLRGLGRFEDAQRCIDRAVSQEPDCLIALLQKGRILHDRSRLDDALRVFDRGLEIDADDYLLSLNRGLVLDDLGRDEEALAVFERCMTVNPNDPSPWQNKGKVLCKQGRLIEAMASFDRALEIDPDNANCWSNKAAIHVRREEWRDAVDCIEKVLQQDRGNTQAWRVHSEALFRLDEQIEALASFDRLAGIAPRMVDGWLGKARCLSILRREPETVLACCQTVVELGGGNLQELRFLNARALYELKRYDEAIAIWDEFLTADSEDTNALVQKGACLVQSDRYREAADAYLAALRLESANSNFAELASTAIQNGYPAAAAAAERGRALLQVGNTQEALACFLTARNDCPEWWEVWTRIGGCQLLLRQFEQAAECLQSSVRVFAGDALAWKLLGDCSLNLNRSQEAVECLDRAVELAPENADAWYSRGLALHYVGREEEAAASFECNLAHSTADEEMTIRQGLVVSRLGFGREAATYFDRAVKLNPQSPKAWFYFGSALGAVGQHLEAIASLDQAVKLKADFADAWSVRGQSLLHTERLEEGIASFDRALKLDPNLVDAWFNRGTACWLAGMHDDADSCFDRVLLLDERHADAWFSKGVIMGHRNARKQELNCYERVLALDSNHVRAWFNQGMLLANAGHYADALACFIRANELGEPQATKAIALCKEHLAYIAK